MSSRAVASVSEARVEHARSILARLDKGEAIEPIMAELSEDDGSAKNARAYDVAADAPMVEPFRNLARRLR